MKGLLLLLFPPLLLGFPPQEAGLTIARLKYGGGGDWYANPSSLPNLLRFIREETGLPVSDRPPTVEITSPELFNYPYLYLTGHGNIRFTEYELDRLRTYLVKGGFLHADDNFGLDESFRQEVARLFPEARLVELSFAHPVYHVYFDFPLGLPKIHEHHGGPPHGYGITIDGRLVLFYSFNTDLGDGWEDPEVHEDPPEKRQAALEMGTNLFLYALRN